MIGAPPTKPAIRPRFRWKAIARALRDEVIADEVLTEAAAMAFYGILALFPGLIALVSLYALIFDPSDVQAQVEPFARVLPAGAESVLRRELRDIVAQSNSTLTLSLVVSVVVTSFTASSGVSALLRAINLAFFEKETRGFFKLRAIAMAWTLATIVLLIVAIATFAIVPQLLDVVGLGALSTAVAWLRWPLFAVVLVFGLNLLYRFGPDRGRKPRWRWTTAGSAAATTLWLMASGGLSLYVENFGNYDKTYGSLSAFIVLLLWFFLSALSVLIGAEIDAVLEERHRKKQECREAEVRALQELELEELERKEPEENELETNEREQQELEETPSQRSEQMQSRNEPRQSRNEPRQSRNEPRQSRNEPRQSRNDDRPRKHNRDELEAESAAEGDRRADEEDIPDTLRDILEPMGEADPQELVGESEHSVRASNKARTPKGSSGRKSTPPGTDDITQRPDELGRRYLEDATEAPGKTRP